MLWTLFSLFSSVQLSELVPTKLLQGSDLWLCRWALWRQTVQLLGFVALCQTVHGWGWSCQLLPMTSVTFVLTFLTFWCERIWRRDFVCGIQIFHVQVFQNEVNQSHVGSGAVFFLDLWRKGKLGKAIQFEPDCRCIYGSRTFRNRNSDWSRCAWITSQIQTRQDEPFELS